MSENNGFIEPISIKRRGICHKFWNIIRRLLPGDRAEEIESEKDPKKIMDKRSNELLEAEKKYIHEWRANRKDPEYLIDPVVNREKDPKDLTGLALSGGGIRSATFCLGVMQALAQKNLFHKFDYLSTVSGGGYIGSSITWLNHKFAKNFPDPEENKPEYLFPYGNGDEDIHDSDLKKRKQARMLKYLRGHGNYLTPGGGITAASLIGVILRGTLLTLLVWLLLAIALMLCLLPENIEKLRPLLGGNIEPAPTWWEILEYLPVFKYIWLGGIYLAGGFVFISAIYSFVTWISRWIGQGRYRARRTFERMLGIFLLVIIALLIIGSLPIGNYYIQEQGGFGAVLAGIGIGIWKYMTSSKDEGAVPLGLIASVGSILFIYGAFLISFQFAYLILLFWNDFILYLLNARIVFFLDEGSIFFWIEETIPVLGGTIVTKEISIGGVQIALIVLSLFLGFCVNLNFISIHRYYRDRLMESFMPDIESALANKTGPAYKADKASLHEIQKCNNICSPYHIVNTNVVLVDSDNRTYKMRGGDNFILSPHYCGSNATGWVRTNKFMNKKFTLSTAMAISGAAANPNTGVGGKGLTRNPLLSLLMALLNLRLGYWIHRPKRPWLLFYPANHFHPGLYEIIAKGYNEKRWFLQLSDGGHFENLGLYELIRRRLKLIVVCDAGADPKFSFSDLQVTLKRIETDFGVTVAFNGKGNQLEQLIPTEDYDYPAGEKYALKGHVVGNIIYPHNAPEGTLVFIKTTMTKDASFEVKGYKGAHPDFPDESTADQFFDEEQFEAYRKLGKRIALNMISDEGLDLANKMGAK